MRYVPRFQRTLFSARRAMVAIVITLNFATVTTLATAASAPARVHPNIPVLATSVSTTTGTWAAVPMGHLNQPLNTFWQLFFRPIGQTNWTDFASSLAVATNGGLLLTTSPGKTLDIGIRPANLLNFSTIVSLSGSGAARPVGLLPSGLANRPSALALGAQNGSSLAIVNAGSDLQVLEGSQDLFAWHTLTTQHSLVSTSSGQVCGLQTITAVAYNGRNALVGGSCNHPGIVGIFSRYGKGWNLVGPTLPESLDHSEVQVLSFQRSASGTSALLSVATGTDTDLVVAWATNNGHWSISPALPLDASWHVTSIGPKNATGIFVLLAGPNRSVQANLLSGPNTSWQRLPPLPAGTATLAFGSKNQIHALVANNVEFSDWMFSTNSNGWIKGQSITIPIQFGSSG
jgi:hypothetical protein